MNDSDLDFLDVAAAVGRLRSGHNVSSVLTAVSGGAAARAGAFLSADEASGSYNRPWTQDEEDFLRDQLGYLSYGDIGRELSRSAAAIKIRQVRCRIPAPSRRPEEMTGNQVANALGVCVKKICALIESGKLPGRVLPGERRIHVVERFALKRWLVNPLNWPYIEAPIMDTSRITDDKLRRLVELKKARWGDEWWSTGQVADYHGVSDSRTCHGRVSSHPRAIQYGNWRIRRSDAVQFVFHLPGKNFLDFWSDSLDAFLILARGVGFSYRAINVMMGLDGKENGGRAAHRINYLANAGMLTAVAERVGGEVTADGYLFVDWRQHTKRFPFLARAARQFSAGKTLSVDEANLIRGIMAVWSRRFAHLSPAMLDIAIRLNRGCSDRSNRYLVNTYAEIKALGVDPFAWRE